MRSIRLVEERASHTHLVSVSKTASGIFRLAIYNSMAETRWVAFPGSLTDMIILKITTESKKLTMVEARVLFSS
jgi:hypothetical protein